MKRKLQKCEKSLDRADRGGYSKAELAEMRERRRIMQVNVNKLRGKIAESGMSNEMVADALGIDGSTFFRKMKADGLSFSIGQMHSLVSVLHMTPAEACDIFLSQNSQ